MGTRCASGRTHVGVVADGVRTPPACSAARAAEVAPVHVGESGYGCHLDGDADGFGCEW
ncbi:MAG: hypothetical protein GEV08_05460 [Acidimicrobiia bacterium]|nr:hypothetical protein [Acidimicrobiia bacterium]